MVSQDCSPVEINKAKEYFLCGHTIKTIAKKLGRTPTSINKALTRFGIRARVKRAKEAVKLPRTTKILNENKVPPSFNRKALRKLLDNWVSFWKVCSYLGEQKVCFYEQSAAGTAIEHRKFLVNGKICSASQLLLMANKIRIANNQSAFLVEGLSW